VGDVDLSVNLGLLELDGCVEEKDLCTGDLLWHGRVHALLVDENSFNNLGVLDAAAGLFLDLDVIDVDSPIGVGNHGDSPDNEFTELVLARLSALAGHRSAGDVLQERLVR